jgi:hypothetical protein
MVVEFPSRRVELRTGCVDAEEVPIPPITRELARSVLFPPEGSVSVLFAGTVEGEHARVMFPAVLFKETDPSWERFNEVCDAPPPSRKLPEPVAERLPFVRVEFVVVS